MTPRQIVGELATNAYQHATVPEPYQPVTAQERWAWARMTPNPPLVVSIFDIRREIVPGMQAPHDPLAEPDRGLDIVDTFAATWETRPSRSRLAPRPVSGKAVYFAIPLPGQWPQPFYPIRPFVAADQSVLALGLAARGATSAKRSSRSPARSEQRTVRPGCAIRGQHADRTSRRSRTRCSHTGRDLDRTLGGPTHDRSYGATACGNTVPRPSASDGGVMITTMPGPMPWAAVELDLDLALFKLRRRFPGVSIWYGEWTGHFWALVRDRLVEAVDPAGLRRQLDAALPPRPLVRRYDHSRSPLPWPPAPTVQPGAWPVTVDPVRDQPRHRKPPRPGRLRRAIRLLLGRRAETEMALTPSHAGRPAPTATNSRSQR